jgi:hypothetical protein
MLRLGADAVERDLALGQLVEGLWAAEAVCVSPSPYRERCHTSTHLLGVRHSGGVEDVVRRGGAGEEREDDVHEAEAHGAVADLLDVRVVVAETLWGGSAWWREGTDQLSVA